MIKYCPGCKIEMEYNFDNGDEELLDDWYESYTCKTCEFCHYCSEYDYEFSLRKSNLYYLNTDKFFIINSPTRNLEEIKDLTVNESEYQNNWDKIYEMLFKIKNNIIFE